MKTVSKNDEVYAILITNDSIKDGSEWFGNQIESLQASRMSYPKGKSFKVHYHILNPRTIKRTQESFIVISGKISVAVYGNSGELLDTLVASAGEAIIVYRGGHGVKILEDSVCYEIKAGQFSYVSEDKEYRGEEKSCQEVSE